MKPGQKVGLVLDAQARLGEGPLWHVRRQTLFWVDILSRELHEFDPSTGRDRVRQLGQWVGCVVPRRRGGLLLALRRGLARFNLRTGKAAMLCRPDRANPGNRFNDGKCDPAGRFWAGTMSVKVEPKRGSLFCLSPDLTVRRRLAQVTISNGLAWSRDGRTLYFVDSAVQGVFAFDFDCATGALRRRRLAIRIPRRDGVPDGLCLDAEGRLWVAHWGGSRVTRWNPETGKLLETLGLPVSLVTSCAFGGPDLKHLYITSARDSLSAAQLRREPLAGGLFVAQPGGAGLPPHEFSG